MGRQSGVTWTTFLLHSPLGRRSEARFELTRPDTLPIKWAVLKPVLNCPPTGAGTPTKNTGPDPRSESLSRLLKKWPTLAIFHPGATTGSLRPVLDCHTEHIFCALPIRWAF